LISIAQLIGVDDRRRDVGRLRGVPIFDRAIKPWRDRQRFGKASFSILTTSCTQLLERIGRSAITSEPAATKMAITARVEASMVNIVAVVLPI
jgi:hypothetical protein